MCSRLHGMMLAGGRDDYSDQRYQEGQQYQQAPAWASDSPEVQCSWHKALCYLALSHVPSKSTAGCPCATATMQVDGGFAGCRGPTAGTTPWLLCKLSALPLWSLCSAAAQAQRRRHPRLCLDRSGARPSICGWQGGSLRLPCFLWLSVPKASRLQSPLMLDSLPKVQQACILAVSAAVAAGERVHGRWPWRWWRLPGKSHGLGIFLSCLSAIGTSRSSAAHDIPHVFADVRYAGKAAGSFVISGYSNCML